MNGTRAGVVTIVLTMTLSGCHLPGRFTRGYAEAEPTGMDLLSEEGPFATAPAEVRGQVRFLFDDFGSLNTDNRHRYGSPWKVVGAAMVRDRHLTEGTRQLKKKQQGRNRPNTQILAD